MRLTKRISRQLLFALHIAVVMAASAESQERRTVDIDIADASPMLAVDLDKTPPTRLKLYVSLVPDVAKYLTSSIVASRYERAMTDYLVVARKRFANNTGVIVQVRLYVDEFGTSYLPPDFLIPLSAGLDPTDAYSEFLNTPAVMPGAIETSARDVSYFLWIAKTADELTISSIPRELTSAFIRQANQMAVLKTRDRSYTTRTINSTLPNYSARSEYWNEQYRRVKEDARYAERRAQIESLTNQFADLQRDMTQLVQRYEALRKKESSNKSLLDTIEMGLRIGEWVTNNGSIFTGGDAAAAVNFDPKIIRAQTTMISSQLKDAEKELDSKTKRLQEVDNSLKRLHELM